MFYDKSVDNTTFVILLIFNYLYFFLRIGINQYKQYDRNIINILTPIFYNQFKG